jgi:hypothetical protein
MTLVGQESVPRQNDAEADKKYFISGPLNRPCTEEGLSLPCSRSRDRMKAGYIAGSSDSFPYLVNLNGGTLRHGLI